MRHLRAFASSLVVTVLLMLLSVSFTAPPVVLALDGPDVIVVADSESAAPTVVVASDSLMATVLAIDSPDTSNAVSRGAAAVPLATTRADLFYCEHAARRWSDLHERHAIGSTVTRGSTNLALTLYGSQLYLA